MKLWEASKSAIEKKLASQGMILLFAVPWAPQGIYAKKDLNSVDDMKGLNGAPTMSAPQGSANWSARSL